MAERAHHQLLVAARALRALVLQELEVVDRAAVEDVVPAADMIGRHADVLAVRGHGHAVPADVVQRPRAGPVQHLLRDALPLEPADGVLLLQDAAGVAVGEPVSGRDDHIVGHQMRRCGQRGGVGGDAQRRAAGHADLAVAPGLGRGPFDGVVAVLDVVLEGGVEALRAALAAHVLQDEDEARVRVAPGLLGQPLAVLDALRVALRIDAAVLQVGRAGEHHRPGSGPGRLVHIGRQPGPVAQRHRLLDRAGRQPRPLVGRRSGGAGWPLGQGGRHARREGKRQGRGHGQMTNSDHAVLP